MDPNAVADTGAYCKARQRLPEGVVKRLYGQVADRLEDGVEAAHRWWGRRVFLADGTTVLRPDAPANQAAYPAAVHPAGRLWLPADQGGGTLRPPARSKQRPMMSGRPMNRSC